jgi:ABC-type Fe3+-hydroxamate transport system substrate-binding protein
MRRALALTLCLILIACDRRAATPAATGPRIVSMSPAIGLILADLHDEPYCVGRDGHDVGLPDSLPIMGDQMRQDYEAIISASPTHVFTQWGSLDPPARLAELAKTNHWVLSDSRLLSLADIRETTLKIDSQVCDALHKPSPSPECAALVKKMDEAFAPHPGRYAGLGRVLLLAAATPPAAFGPGSCHYELLQSLGATPAITSGAAYINLDAEDILRLSPDAIILINPRSRFAQPTPEEAAKNQTDRLAPLTLYDIPAAKNHRLALIDDPVAYIPSTSMIHLADQVREILDGWTSKK